MTGVVLVVDDVPANVKLLEAKLSAEYYDVITANDGYKAIEQAQMHKPDLILLDVMMPGMDGFETCRQLKQDAAVAHIPVVMVTALSDPSDRVNGLEAGADDFITKPINDTALLTRVRSLIRIKMLIDELRLRDQSGGQMGMDTLENVTDVSGSSVMVIDDDAVQSKRLLAKLREEYDVAHVEDPAQAMDVARSKEWDLVVISSLLDDVDGLRLGMQMKALEAMRHVPVVMLVDEEDTNLMVKALDLGVNDYLTLPVDVNEMTARVKTQIRRKRFQDALKSNYKESMSLAITDGLTKLYNRHYLDTHLKNMVTQFQETGKPMAVVIMDMDHFKSVNDTYGHDVGDEVLVQLAKIIVDSVRSADLAARFGGEEFVILMPETDALSAYEAADRFRKRVEETPFIVSHEIGQLTKTTSVGVSYLLPHDTPESLLKRADQALYEAKNGGRNRVILNPPLDGAAPAAPTAPTAVAPEAPVAAPTPAQPAAPQPAAAPQTPIPPAAPVAAPAAEETPEAPPAPLEITAAPPEMKLQQGGGSAEAAPAAPPADMPVSAPPEPSGLEVTAAPPEMKQQLAGASAAPAAPVTPPIPPAMPETPAVAPAPVAAQTVAPPPVAEQPAPVPAEPVAAQPAPAPEPVSAPEAPAEPMKLELRPLGAPLPSNSTLPETPPAVAAPVQAQPSVTAPNVSQGMAPQAPATPLKAEDDAEEGGEPKPVEYGLANDPEELKKQIPPSTFDPNKSDTNSF